MFPLQLTYPTGEILTLTFPSAFLRALHMILLAAVPVTLAVVDGAIEARADAELEDAAILAAREADDERDELSGSTCGTACHFCGRCS